MNSMISVMSSCSSFSVDTTIVARMCHNSVVVGPKVYIDADDAGSTTLSSGVPCTCTVTTHVGKVMEIQSNFTGAASTICGTSMEITGLGVSNGTASHSCNNSTFDVATHTYMNMTVGVNKVQTPYQSTYCVSLDFRYCGMGQFQCNSGYCIPDASRCDSNPDCTDASDEDNCGGGSVKCSEGLVVCPGGQGCMAQAGRCNNVTDCNDGSDEAKCQTEVTTTGVSPTNDPSKPLITVTCIESLYLPPVTTTPTTTTPTTTFTSTTITTIITTAISAAMSTLSSTNTPSLDTDIQSSFTTPTATYNTTGIVRTDTHPTQDSTPPWIIAVSIVIPVVLIAVAVVIYYILSKAKKNDTAKRNPT
ncbi:integumentary mucin C.1-like isoform X2 [Dreissena polymorpha]|uniref:integumentary mucin C.1-like isoform X2 n=1 Tax=Dreissena polymorpha TaxID=45954 RepID=UPI00226460D2|nr:integumentary mucin C.1-like isoform X2 [Dreissena polymorpha]